TIAPADIIAVFQESGQAWTLVVTLPQWVDGVRDLLKARRFAYVSVTYQRGQTWCECDEVRAIGVGRMPTGDAEECAGEHAAALCKTFLRLRRRGEFRVSQALEHMASQLAIMGE